MSAHACSHCWLRWLAVVPLVLGLIVGAPAAWVAADSPPDPPVVVSPAPNSVSPDDVHMEIGAEFHDADGDSHQATDWEIRLEATNTVVWAAYGSKVLTHAHFGDGTFQGPYAGRSTLEAKTTYRFRVRFQDSRGSWSAWTDRQFITWRLDRAVARRVRGLLTTPAPTWRSDDNAPLLLSGGAHLELRALGGPTLLTMADDGAALRLSTGPLLDEPDTLLVAVTAGTTPLNLPPSQLSVVTDHAIRLNLYLPAMRLDSRQEQVLWVSDSGATFYAEPDDDELPFFRLARDTVDQWVAEAGYRVEAVPGVYRLPTTLAFVPEPGREPNAPRYYVSELHSGIKVVTNSGRVMTFADKLLSFSPTAEFPGEGEVGVIGVCPQPGTHNLYATLIWIDDGGFYRIRIVRLLSNDGLRATAVEDILVARGDQGRARPSHQIQQCSFGPDGKLYTFVADGTGPVQAADDRTYNGKVLRLNPDGSAPTDNPRYDPRNPRAPISYQYTKGMRNAYGMTWRPSDGAMYLTENGPNVDRLVRVDRGRDYGWNGSDESMTTNALYVWEEAHWSPVGLTFVEGPAATSFPPDKQGHLLVATAGPVYTKGPQRAGKAIQEFVLEPDGSIKRQPTVFARNIGEGRGSIVDLRLQPDGLYFTDLYLDDGDGGPTAPGGRIWRIRYTGDASFTPSATTGPAPLTVSFANGSTMRGSASWAFGDGSTSTEASPARTFAAPGRYAVQLTMTAPDGTTSEALTLITVTDGGAEPAWPPATTTRLDQPAGPAVVAFPQLGTTLGGGFRSYWAANGGSTRFGYPITSEFRERNPADGQVYVVQYFERARFEYHPEHKGTPYETQLGLLGVQATTGRAGEAAFQRVTGGGDGARYFGETGHTLADPFRQWWEATGGVDSYGLPISEPFEEQTGEKGGPRLVQYFERARLEHRPDEPGTVGTIRIGRLGTALLAQRPPEPVDEAGR